MDKKKIFTATLFIFLLTTVIYGNRSGYLDIEALFAYLRVHPVIAPLIFIVLYMLMVTFFVPTISMNLGAGFIWGTWFGGIISIIGATSGGILAFLISRYLAHDYFNKRFNAGIWQKLSVSIQENNWKFVAFTRANPAFPFGLTSYFFGLTPINLKQFAVSTLIFIIPGAFIIAGIGNTIQGITLSGSGSDIMRNIILGSILLTLFILLSLIAKRYFTSSQKYNNLDLQ